MKLYHGSTEIVEKPALLEKQRLLDFGSGFYTTSNQDQAERWAAIKRMRLGSEKTDAVICVYDFQDQYWSDSKLNIKYFEANEEWLDFVVSNRSHYLSHNYDLIKGPVANDTLYRTLLLYETGILSKQETIIRLKTHILYDQISFHTNKAVSKLKFVNHYKILI